MESLVIDSPFGALELQSHDGKLTHVLKTQKRVSKAAPKCKALKMAQKQLQEYFLGRRQKFDLPLEYNGTDFQKKVWRQLEKISFGHTLSYGEIAKKIKSPKAFRAVGAACGRNKLLIIVPCHRVKSQNGLGGFALGLKVKRDLLARENIGATFSD